jgi:hypothetical protein
VRSGCAWTRAAACQVSYACLSNRDGIPYSAGQIIPNCILLAHGRGRPLSADTRGCFMRSVCLVVYLALEPTWHSIWLLGRVRCGRVCGSVHGSQIGPNFLFRMPNRTRYIPLSSLWARVRKLFRKSWKVRFDSFRASVPQYLPFPWSHRIQSFLVCSLEETLQLVPFESGVFMGSRLPRCDAHQICTADG